MDEGLRALADRVAALEQRVDAMESRAPAASRSAVPDDRGPTLDPEEFWALTALASRVGRHSALVFAGAVNLPGNLTYRWQQDIDAEAMLDANWDAAAEPLAAIGHPIRLAILRQVLAGRHTTAEIGSLDELGTSGQLYHHLRQLLTAGWLRSAGRGRYEIPPPRVIQLLVIVAAAQR